MPRIHGQISSRLTAEFGPASDGWAPPRDAALRTNPPSAVVGYRIGPKRRSGRRRFWLNFATSLLNICGPTWALMLLLGVTQAAELGYLR